MKIMGEQNGPKLTITVTFDSPEQVPVFNEYFYDMVNRMSEDNGAQMTDAFGHEIINVQDAEMRKSSAKLVNKFGGGSVNNEQDDSLED